MSSERIYYNAPIAQQCRFLYSQTQAHQQTYQETTPAQIHAMNERTVQSTSHMLIVD